jgi:hypothetical protein
MWSSLTAGLEQHASGARFELVDGIFRIVPVTTQEDRLAALATVVESVQGTVCDKARALGSVPELSNKTGWSGLAESAGLLGQWANRSSVEVAEAIELVWALSASLAGAIDLDESRRTIPRGSILPLEIDTLRMLRDLNAAARVWLGSFPSAPRLEARCVETPRSRVRPASELLQSIRQSGRIQPDEAKVLEFTLWVADCPGAFATKARSWGCWTMTNCTVAMLVALGTFAKGHERAWPMPAVAADVAHQIERIVLRNDHAVGELLSYLPGDARGVLQSGLEAIRLGAADGV